MYRQSIVITLFLGCAVLSGCQKATPPATDSGPETAAATPEAANSRPNSEATPGKQTSGGKPTPLPKISLGGGASATGSGQSSTNALDASGREFSREEVFTALKPMQILRDEWNGVRQKSVGGQDAGEEFSWIWDHRTSPKQPALVMTAENGKYFRHLRLTYDPTLEQFDLVMTDPEDQERKFKGAYSEPVREVETADKKVHRTYKLQLTEIDPADPKDQWQLVFNQQENNRYLLEMNRKRGNSFQRFETISAQRQGTSFALSDTDYGDRTCVISGGLGTSQVSYQGKSYWVCCSGCQAAFRDDPARWIAEFEEKQKATR